MTEWEEYEANKDRDAYFTEYGREAMSDEAKTLVAKLAWLNERIEAMLESVGELEERLIERKVKLKQMLEDSS